METPAGNVPNPALEAINEAIAELKKHTQVVPPEVVQALEDQNYGSALEILDDLINAMNTNQNVSENAEDIFNTQQQLATQMNDASNTTPIAAESTAFNLKTASRKKKAQLAPPAPFAGQPPMDDMGLNDPEMIGDQAEMQADPAQQQMFFKDHGKLKQWLDEQGDYHTAFIALQSLPGSNSTTEIEGQAEETLAVLQESLEEFYGLDPNMLDIEEQKLDLANKTYKALPGSVKPQEGAMNATLRNAADLSAYCKYVDASNEVIRQAAQKAASSKKSVAKFNLTKSAQAKSMEQVRMWGSDEKRYDPFYRQPVSDWHIIERNKGFGIHLDDHWNVDWEAIWRGAIMDKYSRPYRDDDGNWVGGYIQKRFEVDKWIPETSNMQLKPGQKRKARLPEHGLTEARLQANRAKDDRGYGPHTNTSEPFNWTTASSKKKLSKVAAGSKKKD